MTSPDQSKGETEESLEAIPLMHPSKPERTDGDMLDGDPRLDVPLRNGKLDLTALPAQSLPKDVKLKFDATEHNVTMKNVMKDVAKYGDKYAGNKTKTKGVLTVSILLQNLVQLKAIIKAGPDNMENFWILVILVPLSLVMQLIGAAFIIYLANSKGDTNEQIRRLYGVNKWVLYISSAASLLNTITAAFYLSE